jgi:large subunit ribosomal protein L14
MIQVRSWVEIADNTGARRGKMIGVIGRKTLFGYIGDVIRLHVREADSTGTVKKGQVVLGVIVRSRRQTRRKDGSYIAFDTNSVVLVKDNEGEPIGTRVFGPVAREVRERKFMKIISLASEVV